MRAEARMPLAYGLPVRDVAHYVGCAASALERELLYNVRFRREVAEARLRLEADCLGSIVQAAATNRAAAGWLRKHVGIPRGRNFACESSLASPHDGLPSARNSKTFGALSVPVRSGNAASNAPRRAQKGFFPSPPPYGPSAQKSATAARKIRRKGKKPSTKGKNS